MQELFDFLKSWQLHPVVDHFTIGLLIVGILVDLFATLLPSRVWLRYMAATLMVLGTIAAWGSNLTGGWEADRLRDHVTGPAKEALETHATLGYIVPWVFTGLAIWRLGIGFIGFLGRTRAIYLIIAVLAGGLLLYQGRYGGELVYAYGVGTDVMNPQPGAPSASVAASVSTPIPTVFVPSPTPTASATPETTPSAETSPVPSETSSAAASSGTAISPPSPQESPAAQASPGTKGVTL
jgi:uncharacterized membrane protein